MNICLQTLQSQVQDIAKEAFTQTRLYWNYLKLQSLPQSLIEDSPHVEKIHLKCNLLTRLPDNFGCLAHLTCCNLNSNSLESLPDSFGDLKSLKILDVGNNKLTSLPVTLAKVPSLRSLVAVHNKLKHFPPELCGLKSLSILMLSGNYITYLPEAVKGLTGLQGFYVDHNLLTEVPRSLTFLPVLARLSFCCNSIAYLPALPFASTPRIYFDNCEVNYLPFSLVCQMHCGSVWDTVILQTCGYFPGVAVEDNTVRVSISRSGRQKYPNCLVLPPQIRKVTSCVSGCVSVPPLEAMCLSLVWKCTNPNSVVCEAGLCCRDLTPGMLPKSLLSMLEVGPISWCSNSECQSPIFISASIIVTTIGVSPKYNTGISRIPMLMYFCSDACGNNIIKSLEFKTDHLSRWIFDKLKRAHNIEILCP